MAGRSSIERLDPRIRVEVDRAIKRGLTVDEITQHLERLGADISRSAVGRYSKRYRELADRQRDLAAVAKAFGSEFGDTDNEQGKLLVQLITSVAARAALPLATDEDVEIDGKELHFLARATKDIISAAKIDTERDEKIREAAAKKAKAEAARDAEQAARDAGASEATIDMVKKRILGLT